MSARVSYHELEGDDAELNLTPYLDVVLNLVVFLLLSFLSVSSFRLIDLETPGLCADCAGAPRFELVLSLGPDGALISASDGSVSSEHLPGPLDPERLRDALAS